MKKCKMCGAQVRDEAMFCTSCGAPFEDEENTTVLVDNEDEIDGTSVLSDEFEEENTSVLSEEDDSGTTVLDFEEKSKDVSNNILTNVSNKSSDEKLKNIFKVLLPVIVVVAYAPIYYFAYIKTENLFGCIVTFLVTAVVAVISSVQLWSNKKLKYIFTGITLSLFLVNILYLIFDDNSYISIPEVIFGIVGIGLALFNSLKIQNSKINIAISVISTIFIYVSYAYFDIYNTIIYNF